MGTLAVVIPSALIGLAILAHAITQWGKVQLRRLENERAEREAEKECPHLWGQWEDTGTKRIFASEEDKIPIRRELVQRRQCEMCGLTDVKKTET